MRLPAHHNRLCRNVLTILRTPRSLHVVFAAVCGLLACAQHASAQYLYEDWSPVNYPPTNVRISAIKPGQYTIAWDYTNFNPAIPPQFIIWRNGVNVQTTTNHYWTDSPPVVFIGGTAQLQYGVQLVGDENADPGYSRMIPPCTPDSEIDHLNYNSGTNRVSINVNLVKSVATENQSVDSRLDPRFSTNTYVNFPFGSKVYRGGLFAGYAQDSASVGRTYLNFHLPPVPDGAQIWTASLFGWFTRCSANSSVTVGAANVGTGWTETSINWSNAPAVDTTQFRDLQSVSYSGLDTDAKECSWNIAGDVVHCLFTNKGMPQNGLVAFALASTSETTNGWAYFAKRQWTGGPAGIDTTPYIIYAYGSPNWPLSLWFNPASPAAGGTSTAMLTMTGNSGSGATVFLGSDNPNVATVPASVTVWPNGSVATFTVTAVGPGTCNISATFGGYTIQAPITVTGGCGPPPRGP